MRLGVVGGGTVGRATARAFMEHAEVRVYDVLPDRRTHDLDDVLACDLVMVCLPTPAAADGLRCNTGPLDEFFAGVVNTRGDDARSAHWVVRSTVPVGYTRRLRDRHRLESVCHSPEFLTARCAVTDAQVPARNVIGEPGRHPSVASVALRRLYEDRFPGVPVYVMTSDESELVKLTLNAFFAVKVSYWNEVYAYAAGRGLDWDAVMAGVLSDGRVAHSHTRVPGPDGRRGFGGLCLPKDLGNLIDCIETLGLTAPLMRAARERNALDRGGEG